VKALFQSIREEIALLGGLSDAAVERVAEQLREMYFEAGETIAREDDEASALFIIASGRVRITRELGGGKEPLTLAELSAGACVGEMALIDMQPRGASVTAINDVVLYMLSNEDFMKLFEDDQPAYTLILGNIARELSRRLRHTNEALTQLLRDA